MYKNLWTTVCKYKKMQNIQNIIFIMVLKRNEIKHFDTKSN